MALNPATTNLRSSSPQPGSTNYSAMAMVTTLFFTWGFCTVLNDAVIPHLQSIFELSYLQASLIQLAFFSSYFRLCASCRQVGGVGRIQIHDGHRSRLDVPRCASVRSGSHSRHLFFLPRRRGRPGRGRHAPAGRGKSLRHHPRSSRDRVESPEPHPGLQYPWRHGCALYRRRVYPRQDRNAAERRTTPGSGPPGLPHAPGIQHQASLPRHCQRHA